ncbi:MarR family transcriptional regulator [Streptomyces sp. MNU77]|nr:MarR family transcriptional regulator [Streptomyces sp. MNU77]
MEAVAERFGFQVKRVQLLFAGRYAETLERHGLSPGEFTVLTLVGEEPGASQRHLGRQLYIDRTSVVSLVDALESKELVVRSRSATDRRAIAVAPTAAGRRVLDRATAEVRDMEEDFLGVLPAARRAVLRGALTELVRAYSDEV